MNPASADELPEPPARERRPASPRWVGFLLGTLVLALVAGARSCRFGPVSAPDPAAAPLPAPFPSDTTMPGGL